MKNRVETYNLTLTDLIALVYKDWRIGNEDHSGVSMRIDPIIEGALWSTIKGYRVTVTHHEG